MRRKFVIQQEPVLRPEEVSEMPRLFTDTTCTPDEGSFSWEGIYKLFKDENPRIIQKQIENADDYPPYNNDTWNDVANSFLHRIVARPKSCYIKIW